MKSITVNVQIQFDQFNNQDPIQYAHSILGMINAYLEKEFEDICPQILNITPSPDDIFVDY